MDFAARLQAFIDQAKESAKDGLTFGEMIELVFAFVRFAVQEAEGLMNAGPQKKQIVMEWVGKAFDTLAPLVPVPAWYRVFQPFIRPILRQIILQAADGILEAHVKKLKTV